MKNSVTYSVLFWIKGKKNKLGKHPIYARVTINGKRAEISTKQNIQKLLWDAKRNRAKGNSQEARIINQHLENFRTQLFECYQELKNEGKFITSKKIKARFQGEDENTHTLIELISYHNQELRDTISSGTLKHYFTTEKYLKLFLKQKLKTTDIFLNELSYKFIVDFEIFLRNWSPNDHQKPMGNNTAMKHIQRLRKMVNLALNMEWIEKDPFRRFKSKYIKKEREFLSEEELTRLIEKSFSIERLDLVKDLFLFSCYTGLSYIDVVDLTHDNIVKGINGEDWIYTERRKTNTPVKIPILGTTWDIIEKYKDHPKIDGTDKLLPSMSNQKLNSYLKEIADLCGISKHLTFHMARHTFATTVTLCNGVPIETVSKLLGHSKLTTTQIYARVVERKVAEDMQTISDKYSKKGSTKTG